MWLANARGWLDREVWTQVTHVRRMYKVVICGRRKGLGVLRFVAAGRTWVTHFRGFVEKVRHPRV